MANSSSSYIKNESIEPLYSGHGTNLSYLPSSSTSIHSDTDIAPSNERPSDHSQNASALPPRVYLNMGIGEQRDGTDPGRMLTTDTPSSHPYVNYGLPSTANERQSHHYRPHRPQARNRYPYVPYFERRPKSLNGIINMKNKL